MKRLPLIAFVACLMTATAQAQPPVAAAQTASAEEAPAPVAQAEAPVADAKAAPATEKKPRLSDANCLRETGSRIPRRDGKPRCNGQPGRAYSKDDIDRTGHINLADALRALDPAVR